MKGCWLRKDQRHEIRGGGGCGGVSQADSEKICRRCPKQSELADPTMRTHSLLVTDGPLPWKVSGTSWVFGSESRKGGTVEANGEGTRRRLGNCAERQRTSLIALATAKACLGNRFKLSCVSRFSSLGYTAVLTLVDKDRRPGFRCTRSKSDKKQE